VTFPAPGHAVPDDVTMPAAADRRRSLEELEGDKWGDPPAGSTRLVAAVHRLRQKPIGELTIEDLRVLIRQHVSPDKLVPLAIDRLHQDPLAAGDLYEGDLLSAVLAVDSGFWTRHSTLAEDVRMIIGSFVDAPNDLAAEIARFERRV
jgi:hypothetical protein